MIINLTPVMLELVLVLRGHFNAQTKYQYY